MTDDSFDIKSLTNSQQKVFVELIDFLKSENQVFLLTGYAGTGKTFLVDRLCKHLRVFQYPFRLMAPTGRAAKVLKSKTRQQAYTIHKTIYSLNELEEFQSKESKDETTFKYFFRQRNNDDDANCIYIIDEASMISDFYSEEEFFRYGSGFLLKDLFDYVDISNPALKRKIVFVGDNAQLPPVNSNFSFALSKEYLFKNYNIKSKEGELSDIVRQLESSGIVKNSWFLRNSISEKRFNRFFIDSSFEGIEKVEPESIAGLYVSNFAQNNYDDIIIIARTNKSVRDYNLSIRKLLFPNSHIIQNGDRILVVTNSYNRQIEILNGDFGFIVSVSPVTEVIKTVIYENKEKKIIENEFRDLVIRFWNINNEPVDISCKIFENLLNSDKPNLTSDETKALYIDFKIRHPTLSPKSQEFKDTLNVDPYFNALRIKYGYAVTCHKAQGGEWKNAIIDFYTHSGILNSNYFRWAYTALTRAKEKVYFLNGHEYRKSIDIIESSLSYGLINPMPQVVDNLILVKIGENKPFSKKLYLAITALIQNTNICIKEIKHNSYRDRYIFQNDSELYCFDFIYNNKNKVTTINYLSSKSSITKNDISIKISQILRAVINKTIHDLNLRSCKLNASLFNDNNLFIKELLDNLSNKLDQEMIYINSVTQFQWRTRLEFFRNNEIAAFDLVYNSKKQITQLIQITDMSSSEQLMIDTQNILMESL